MYNIGVRRSGKLTGKENRPMDEKVKALKELLEIFGQQDYIKTSKPESMSGKEIYRWVDWERENMN